MKKDKRLGEDPFEKFLPQITDSRKKKDDAVNNDKNINKDSDGDNNKINGVDKNNVVVTNKIVNNDVNNRDDVNIYKDDVVINGVDKNVDVITDDNKNIAVDESVGTGKGTITIAKKKNKSDDYLRVTYYLRPDQARAINRLHKDSGRDKSELVRLAVDILIEQARVE